MKHPPAPRSRLPVAVGLPRFGEPFPPTLPADAPVALACCACGHTWNEVRAVVIPDGSFNGGIVECPECGMTHAAYDDHSGGIILARPDYMAECERCGTLSDVWRWVDLAVAGGMVVRKKRRCSPADHDGDAVCFACFGAETESFRRQLAYQLMERMEEVLDDGAVVDFETTGLRSRAVVEVGVVFVDLCIAPDGRYRTAYHSLVNPGEVEWEPGLPHGLTPETLADAPSWPAVHDRIAEILRNASVRSVISWSYFEAGVLFFEQDRIGGPSTRQGGIWRVESLIDAMSMYLALIHADEPARPGTVHRRVGLQAASDAFGLGPTDHRAVSDALRLVEVLVRAGAALHERLRLARLARERATSALHLSMLAKAGAGLTDIGAWWVAPNQRGGSQLRPARVLCVPRLQRGQNEKERVVTVEAWVDGKVRVIENARMDALVGRLDVEGERLLYRRRFTFESLREVSDE